MSTAEPSLRATLIAGYGTLAVVSTTNRIEVVAFAASAGGLEAIAIILHALRSDFPAAVIISMHLSPGSSARLETFRGKSKLPVCLIEAGMNIEPGRVYVAPPAHSVELEPDRTATLNPLPNARHTIDATLTSIAESYGARALAVVLTGMRTDGAAGARAIKEHGGHVLVQSPDTSIHPSMPEAAIATGAVDLVLPLSDIAPMLDTIVTRGALPATRQRVAAIDAVLGGPGETRRILRAIDWSESSLGAVETWGPELRSAVGMVLGSPTPAVLFWGEERVLFYSDASIPVMGPRHPLAAGRPLAVGWPGVAEQISKIVDSVRATGQAVKFEDMLVSIEAGGRFEERYFTASYCAVPTDNEVPGVFEPFVETTDGVLARRRITTLASLAAVPLASTSNEAYSALVGALAQNAFDLPFVMAYAVDHTHKQARLKATAGVTAGTAFAPHIVELSGPRAAWPLANLVESKAPLHITDLLQRFTERVMGPWDEATAEALLLPLLGVGADAPNGVLIVGLNQRRPLDASYREFLHLVGAQVSAGVGEAQAFETGRARAKALAEANRAKTEFFSNVSHEFRTPLTLILGPLERARTSRNVPEDVALELEVAERNARRLQGLVSALLDIAQLEAKRLVPRLEDVDLAADTRELAAHFRAPVEQAGIEFVVDCQLSRPVRVDRTMWAKIVVNLLANALKFTFSGKIEVIVRERAHHAELVVTDTGVGIAMADQPHVFERFFRGNAARARTYEGSGVGLALVKDVVRSLNGRVRLKSEEGRGTTVTVWVPIRLAPLAPIAQRAAAEPDAREREAVFALAAEQALALVRPSTRPAGITPGAGATQDSLEGLEMLRASTSKVRVLVVDDNADMRTYLERLLSDFGWIVQTASDGEDAFSRLHASRPDLVIADVIMPRADGFELLRRVRSDAELRSTPVVLVTARAGEASALEGLVAGANDYIGKPFSARELVARLGAQIEIAKLRRRAEERDGFLLKLSDALRALTDPLDIMGAAARMVAEHLRVDRVAYGEVTADGQANKIEREHAAAGAPSLIGTYHFADFPKPVAELVRGVTFVSEDVPRDARFSAEGKAVFAAMGSASNCSVPLIKGGRFVANFNLHHAEPRAWPAHEVALIEDVADRTWAAVERARAEKALRASEERKTFLLELSDAVRFLVDPTEIMSVVCERVGRYFGVGRCGYAEVPPPHDHFHVARDWTNGIMASLRGTWRVADFGEGFVSECGAGRTLVTDDALSDECRGGHGDGLKAAGGIRASIAVPLIKHGNWIGAFYVQDTKARAWSQADVKLLEEVAERVWAWTGRA